MNHFNIFWLLRGFVILCWFRQTGKQTVHASGVLFIAPWWSGFDRLHVGWKAGLEKWSHAFRSGLYWRAMEWVERGCKSKTCTVNLHACLKFECIKEGNSGDKGAEINTRMVFKTFRWKRPNQFILCRSGMSIPTVVVRMWRPCGVLSDFRSLLTHYLDLCHLDFVGIVLWYIGNVSSCRMTANNCLS